MKYSEKLQQQYAQDIASWDWDAIENGAHSNPHTDECGDVVGSQWLGSVTTILPSRKIYAPWTTHQTVRDMIRDQAFMLALEDAAENLGLYIQEESGDLYAYTTLDMNGEFYYAMNDGFYRNGERVAETEQELSDLMDSEGYYPNVFTLDGRDCIAGYYEFETGPRRSPVHLSTHSAPVERLTTGRIERMLYNDDFRE